MFVKFHRDLAAFKRVFLVHSETSFPTALAALLMVLYSPEGANLAGHQSFFRQRHASKSLDSVTESPDSLFFPFDSLPFPVGKVSFPVDSKTESSDSLPFPVDSRTESSDSEAESVDFVGE
jgi:hypothetical protein